MIKLEALTKIATENKIAYKMNVAKVERIKDSIKDGTRMIELCFKECDNMLAAKITIQNIGFPFSDEFGVNEKFLNAILEAMTGNLEELRSFDPTNQYAEEGNGLKYELLTSFLAVKDLKPQVRNITLKDNETQLLEVVFQLGYLRKVKFYFQANDNQAITQLKAANINIA
ncbi:unknown [Bacteroides sp. CAG:443]|nr:unknown [Bacteroides sp. CAG:443]